MDRYLGPFNSITSSFEYDRLISEWLTSGRRDIDTPTEDDRVSVVEILADYPKFAESYDARNGKQTSEYPIIVAAAALPKRLYGRSQAAEFGSLALKAARERFTTSRHLLTKTSGFTAIFPDNMFRSFSNHVDKLTIYDTIHVIIVSFVSRYLDEAEFGWPHVQERTMSSDYWESLERRRRDLGISFPALSGRSGVSVPTLKRLFAGKATNPTVRSLQAVCSVLGVELRIDGAIEVVMRKSSEQVRASVAKLKAEQLVKLVQGTSALESQAVGRSAIRDMVARTVRELLTGPNSRLWSS